MDGLNEDQVNKACGRLWELRHSLLSLGTLFEGGSRDLSMEEEEYCGVGQMLKILSREVHRVENFLYHGEDFPPLKPVEK